MAWTPPAWLLRTAADTRVPYDGAPPWGAEDACAGGWTTGARALAAYIRRHFPGVRDVQGYACRPNTASPTNTSIHGTGRALDVMFDRESPDGDVLANWLVANAPALGLQYLIWNRTSWSGTHGFRPYTGPHSHADHVHLELNDAAAAERAPFFADGIHRAPWSGGTAQLIAWLLVLGGLSAGAYFYREGRRR